MREPSAFDSGGTLRITYSQCCESPESARHDDMAAITMAWWSKPRGRHRSQSDHTLCAPTGSTEYCDLAQSRTDLHLKRGGYTTFVFWQFWSHLSP